MRPSVPTATLPEIAAAESNEVEEVEEVEGDPILPLRMSLAIPGRTQ
jgi:hypothetical protein